ncbi:MAG: xanthine dehydrogenase family protein molybdopterin-binding subunit, partial [Nitrososphaeria archaeon]
MQEFTFVGRERAREDAYSKVRGSEVYTIDISFPNMLYGRIIHSEHPRARVKSIDWSEAREMGAYCLTYEDVPRVVFNPRLVSTEEATYKDWTVLTDSPKFVGEPIAVCLAESEEKAQIAATKVKVDYELLPPYFDAETALSSQDSIHRTILLANKVIEVKNNVACTMETVEGDPDRAFREADYVFERTYRTNRRYHVQMEPKGAVVNIEPNGILTVYTTTQSIHNTRILISRVFGIPQNRINVKKVTLGGSFGSSIQTNLVTLIAVAAALRLKRPVKIILTREEDLYEHSDYQMKIKLRAAVRKDGTIIGGEMEMIMDIGAHQIQAYPLLGTA